MCSAHQEGDNHLYHLQAFLTLLTLKYVPLSKLGGTHA
jgi:hypothetical protein